jgi:hypothetical protein
MGMHGCALTKYIIILKNQESLSKKTKCFLENTNMFLQKCSYKIKIKSYKNTSTKATSSFLRK